MVKKSALFFTSLLVALAFNTSVVLAQDEEAAPKISISFADDAEETPAETAPAPQPTAAPAGDEAAGTTEGAKPQIQFTDEEELWVLYGWLLVYNNQLDLLEFSDREKLAFRVGVQAGLSGRVIADWEEKRPEVAQLIEQRMAPVVERARRELKVRAVNMFAELAKQENVKKSPTGLFYEIVSEGTGKFPTEGSPVLVEYNATLVDGTVFDTTEGRGPVPVALDDNVPAGFKEGIMNIREGGIIKLWVPSSLGFGSEERPGIPPDSALMFEITLHEIGTVNEDAQ